MPGGRSGALERSDLLAPQSLPIRSWSLSSLRGLPPAARWSASGLNGPVPPLVKIEHVSGWLSPESMMKCS